MHNDKFMAILVEAHVMDLTLRQAVLAGLSKDVVRNVHVQIEKLKRMMVGRRLVLMAGGATKADRKRIGRESQAITKQLKVVRNVCWQAFDQLHRQLDPAARKRDNAVHRKAYEQFRALAVKDISGRVKGLMIGDSSSH